jgi:hypothetical protein
MSDDTETVTITRARLEELERLAGYWQTFMALRRETASGELQRKYGGLAAAIAPKRPAPVRVHNSTKTLQ